MPNRKDSRRFLLWLSLTTLVLTVGLAVISAISLRQSASVEATARLQADSTTWLTFQLEREYLRFRSELRAALRSRDTPDWGAVEDRYNILASRIEVLQANPSTERLRQLPQYSRVMPRLTNLIGEVEPLLLQPETQRDALKAKLDVLLALGPDVQELSHATNRQVSALVEQQVAVVREQNRMIGWLVGLQVLTLAVAAIALVNRHRRLNRERLALEGLNRALVEARDQAEQANRAKSQFLANMSHELRTPFNGLLGMLDVLDESELGSAQRDQLQTARDSAQHLLARCSTTSWTCRRSRPARPESIPNPSTCAAWWPTSTS